jgi:transcriptional regulator with XRE-family HTH domain
MELGLSFGEILGDLLSEKNVTQKQLAKALNIPPSTLSNYFQGVCEPNFETLKQIAGYFNVSTDFMLDFRTNQTISHDEDELLRLFRSIPSDLQEIFIGQCRVLSVYSDKKVKSSGSKTTGRAG